jgi:hypothetical protein
MLKFYILTVILASLTLCEAQKPFIGHLEYNIINVDLMSKDTIRGKLFIYALDSLVRYNYIMEDGKKQESIHHLGQQKLLSLIEFDAHFFAVQIKDSNTENTDFKYQRMHSKQRIQGLKCKEARVISANGSLPLFYTKKIEPRYFVGLKQAPGLPIKGQIPTSNGYMAFDLQKIDERQPPLQLFIPDKKFQLITLEAFLTLTQGQ